MLPDLKQTREKIHVFLSRLGGSVVETPPHNFSEGLGVPFSLIIFVGTL